MIRKFKKTFGINLIDDKCKPEETTKNEESLYLNGCKMWVANISCEQQTQVSPFLLLCVKWLLIELVKYLC